MKPDTFLFRGQLAQFRVRADTSDTWEEIWAHAEIKQHMHWAELGELGVYRRGFSKYLPKNGLILEAGCGTGRYVMALKQRGYRIIGVDWAEVTLSNVKEYWKQAPLIIGEISYLPLPAASVTAILSLGVIEHYLNPWILLEDSARVLKPSGILYLVIPFENRLRRWRKSQGKYPQRNEPEDFYQFLLNRNDIEKELKNLGFSIIACFGTSGYAGLVGKWKGLDRFVQHLPFSHHWINFLNRSWLLGSITGHVIHMICEKPSTNKENHDTSTNER